MIMFRFVPHILSFSLVLGFAPALPQTTSGVLIQLCSGKSIRLDIGQDDSPPQQPIHSNACHAICCQRDGDMPDIAETDDDDLTL